MKVFYHIGRYFLFLLRVIKVPDRWSEFWKACVKEVYELGLSSMGIVIFISIFVGMVVALQMAFNIQDSPLLADYYIGYTTRESLILEFSPTMISLILAGKVGSSIASNLGTMRTTEQIDALEVMGVNSASYLVMPKIVAGVFFNPFLITLSISFGILGGYLAGILTGMWSGTDYYIGITDEFRAYTVVYALIKTVFFAFLIASVAAYHGYHTKGGAIDVGRSSTQAVVFSSISIIVLNYFLTQIML